MDEMDENDQSNECDFLDEVADELLADNNLEEAW